MDHLSTPGEAREATLRLRAGGRSVGIVPTMGALHEGHLSLIRRSTSVCDTTIATIFVNPTQFGPNEDLDKYPRTLEQDCDALRAAGVHAVYAPAAEAMYPEGYSTFVQPPEVAHSLEGICRPDHFRGVTTVVLKLFQAVPATHAFFGKKDYQQWKVVEAMTRDLNLGVEIVGCETVRESDGLALSSRNRYLSAEDRPRALLLDRALSAAETMTHKGERNVERLQAVMRQTLLGSTDSSGVDKIDYAVVVDAEHLSPIAEIDRPAVALVAAHVAGTRLIDNRELTAP